MVTNIYIYIYVNTCTMSVILGKESTDSEVDTDDLVWNYRQCFTSLHYILVAKNRCCKAGGSYSL